MRVICFRFLFCLGYNLVIIGDTYVVYWFSGCCLFIGSLVRWLLLVVVWLKFESLRSWGYICACSCFLVALLLVIFFFFTSALQSWGHASTIGAVFCTLRCSGPAPTSGPTVLSFVVSSEVEI